MSIILDAERLKCEQKRAYATKKSALGARSKNSHTTLWVYKCTNCRKWHLTKVAPRNEHPKDSRITVSNKLRK